MTWRAFPTADRPKLWLGPRDRCSTALRMYSPYSLRGRVIKSLARFVPNRLLRAVLSPVQDPDILNMLADMEDWLKAQFLNDDITISGAPGTPGPDQKITLQVTNSENHSIAYAKIAQSTRSAALLSNEQQQLHLLKQTGMSSVLIPDLLAFESNSARTVLLQSAAPADFVRSDITLSRSEIDSLLCIGAVCKDKTTIDQLLKTIPTAGNITEIQQSTDYLQLTFADRPLSTRYSHGDFVPWNLRRKPNRPLFAFDWEYADPNQVALFDLLHYLFMPRMLLTSRTPLQVVKNILSIAGNPDCAGILQAHEVNRVDLPAYLIAYLLILYSRGISATRNDSSFVIACLHHALVCTGWADVRPRVLVAAYACEPDQGSEPGVGWNMAHAIAKNNDVTVITRRNNAAAIEKKLARSPLPGLDFVFVDLSKWASFWKKGGRGVRTYYYLWQLAAWRKARALCRDRNFDISHHVTFVNDWIYSFLSLLPVPFVWGPVGSNPEVPSEFASTDQFKFRDHLRRFVQRFIRTCDPLLRHTATRASLVVTIDESRWLQTPLHLVESHRRRTFPAIGTEFREYPTRAAQDNSEGFTVLTAGRLLPIKGFDHAIQAFGIFASSVPDSRMIIVGSGPEKPRLQRIAELCTSTPLIQWVDWMKRTDFMQLLAQADVLLYPSCEGAGMVVLEAMMAGLPVVCLDFGGPGSLIDSDCGVRVRIADARTMHCNLANALQQYYSDERLRIQHGEAARDRAIKRYDWERRPAIVTTWYEAVFSEVGPNHVGE